MLLGYTLAAENARCFCAFNCKSMSTGWEENCLICTNGGQGGTDLSRYLYVHELEVSTHTSVQGATVTITVLSDYIGISTHAPRTGGDLLDFVPLANIYEFQPTPPAQGATRESGCRCAMLLHFNPRPPHRGRPPTASKNSQKVHFNPRPPHRGRLYQLHYAGLTCRISTHAPRTGGDLPT